jgi:predicted phosphodiesterase
MSITKLFIYGDVHAPYHDKKAVSCMLKAMDAFKPDIVIDLGDFWDCYACSAYKKNPTRWRRLVDEIKAGLPLIQDIEAAARNADLISFDGNHEQRLDTLLQQPMQHSLHGAVSIDSLAPRTAWRRVGYEEYAQIGRVIYTHDVGFCSTYALKDSLREVAHSIVTGHTHRMGSWIEGTLKGKHLISTSFGWLGDMKKADYMHTAKKARHWCHGFGLGRMIDDGTTWLSGVPIIRGRAVVDSKLIEG